MLFNSLLVLLRGFVDRVPAKSVLKQIKLVLRVEDGRHWGDKTLDACKEDRDRRGAAVRVRWVLNAAFLLTLTTGM